MNTHGSTAKVSFSVLKRDQSQFRLSRPIANLPLFVETNLSKENVITVN